jgi:hypothetical protein
VDGVWTCGPSSSAGSTAASTTSVRPDLSGISPDDVTNLLRRLFPAGAPPLELNAVVDLAAAAWGVPLVHHDDSFVLDTLPTREPRIDHVLQQRVRLDLVWSEIRELPVRQRHAVLLNLRDDAITLFLTSGVLSLRDLAAALELPIDDVAALWNELPLPDNAIAERLGCTRQQVINLRMAARKRLVNRLGGKANISAGRAL